MRVDGRGGGCAGGGGGGGGDGGGGWRWGRRRRRLGRLASGTVEEGTGGETLGVRRCGEVAAMEDDVGTELVRL